MKPTPIAALLLLAGMLSWHEISAAPQTVPDTQRVPAFHHLHLNSTDPEAAIAFYIRQFPTSSRASWGGIPALTSSNNVLVLFNKVDNPPPADPQATAFWHFGWYVEDVRRNLALYESRAGINLVPIYTSNEGRFVFVDTDGWFVTDTPNFGLSKEQLADLEASGKVPPLAGEQGSAYLQGPDNSLVEYAGYQRYMIARGERFSHVHMFQEEPLCAQVWYSRHFNVPLPPIQPTITIRSEREFQNSLRTETGCQVAFYNERGRAVATRVWPALQREGLLLNPRGTATFGDVQLNWHIRQTDQPLVSTRGHVMDHVALSVANLDAWVAKLRAENVRFLEQEYRLGGTRAVMIEGPSREAIELVEIK